MWFWSVMSWLNKVARDLLGLRKHKPNLMTTCAVLYPYPIAIHYVIERGRDHLSRGSILIVAELQPLLLLLLASVIDATKKQRQAAWLGYSEPAWLAAGWENDARVPARGTASSASRASNASACMRGQWLTTSKLQSWRGIALYCVEGLSFTYRVQEEINPVFQHRQLTSNVSVTATLLTF